MRQTCLRKCAALANGAAASCAPSASAVAPLDASAVASFQSWMEEDLHVRRLHDQGVALRLRPDDTRGLVATRPFREGVTVLSVPMAVGAISATSLLRHRPTLVERFCVPSFDDVRREMNAFSVRDPVVHQQMHLALLVAAERSEDGGPSSSLWAPYYNVLPHPAIDDKRVMGMHKDVLDPMQLIEWDDHQRVFVTLCRALHQRWGRALAARAGGATAKGGAKGDGPLPTQPPPLEVLYWAFRTVLSRMHMLPDRGLAAPTLGNGCADANAEGVRMETASGKRLNYAAYATIRQVSDQESLVKRTRNLIRGILSSSTDNGDAYRLMPTLVPLIDMCGHLSTGNVSVEVQPRPGVGSCVELQAVAPIAAGDAIGMCLNRSQSIAFTLYRFGFLPI